MARFTATVVLPTPDVYKRQNGVAHLRGMDMYGKTAITVTKATIMSGRRAATSNRRIGGNVGWPTTGNTVMANMCWLKVTGGKLQNADKKAGHTPRFFSDH